MAEFSTGVIIIFLLFYFLPTIIAAMRSKSNTLGIFALNLFLGWTFVGWIVSLVWSLTSDNKPQTIVVNNHVSADRTINPILTQPIQETEKVEFQPQPLIGNTVFKSHEEKITQLQQLKQLLDNGVLTEEEFAEQKVKSFSYLIIDKNAFQILQDWHELLKSGVITEEEFADKKRELIGSGKALQEKTTTTIDQIHTTEEQASIDAEYDTLFNNQSWFRRNRDWIIGVSIALVIGIVIWYFTTDNSVTSNEAAIVESTPTTFSYYVVKADEYNRIYFYRKPDASTKKAAYFNSRTTVFVQQIENGFGYVEFTNDMGQKSKGWLDLQDLEYCSNCSEQ